MDDTPLFPNIKNTDAIIADERERCALLAETLAERWEASAAGLRKRGGYWSRSIWPPFRKVWFVMAKWEQAARDTEAAANGLRTIAEGCRKGWDPRKPVNPT